MKKLNITKEQFEKSEYFKNKYGELEYVNESGKVFKTTKNKVLRFKESSNTKDEPYSVYKFINTLHQDYNEYMLERPKILGGIGDGWKEISIMCSKSQYRKMLGVVKKYCQKYGWEYQSNKIYEDVFEIIVSEWDESTLTDDFRESTNKFDKKFKESASNEKPKFKIGQMVNLSPLIYHSFEEEGIDENDIPKTGWKIDNVQHRGVSGFVYNIIHTDQETGEKTGMRVYEQEIEASTKKFDRKFADL